MADRNLNDNDGRGIKKHFRLILTRIVKLLYFWYSNYSDHATVEICWTRQNDIKEDLIGWYGIMEDVDSFGLFWENAPKFGTGKEVGATTNQGHLENGRYNDVCVIINVFCAYLSTNCIRYLYILSLYWWNIHIFEFLFAVYFLSLMCSCCVM